MRSQLTTVLFFYLLISFLAVDAVADECSFGRRSGFAMELSAAVDATDAHLLEVVAGEGRLEVEGKPGLTEVRVTALACATDEETLEQTQLVAERRGDAVHVEAVLPGWLQRVFNRDEYSRLDLTIEAPADIASDIVDTSGPIDLQRLGSLTLRDGTGPIRAEGLYGPVRINDDSGEMRISDVTGPVTIDDTSGLISLTDVQGDVVITDTSGQIDVRRIGGSVDVSDGSGNIDIANTTGKVTIHRDSTGSVRLRDIESSL